MSAPTRTTQDLVLRAGTAATDAYELEATPATAGWGHTSVRVLALAPSAAHTVATGVDELLVVPLAGSAVVACGDEELTLQGRGDVFSGPTDFAYLPIESTVTVRSEDGGRFALTGARTDRRLSLRYSPGDTVVVGLRGAGQASRLVRNFGTVGAFETGSLIACEVLTPGGNWSSYPARKHDEASEPESELEEISYVEIATGPGGEPGFGFHQTGSSARGAVEVLAEVRDRDTALVPFGRHGPCVAAPGHDMYDLNVMAGPADDAPG